MSRAESWSRTARRSGVVRVEASGSARRGGMTRITVPFAAKQVDD